MLLSIGDQFLPRYGPCNRPLLSRPPALVDVVVDHAHGLHESVADGGADEPEPPRFQVLRHRVRLGRGRGDGIEGDDAGEADHRRLDEVRKDREQAAESYFEQIAPQWDRLRSLYVSEAAVEAARAGGMLGYFFGADLGAAAGR